MPGRYGAREHRPMNKTLIAALVAATALLAPAAAQAATVSQENGAIVYRGEGSEGLSLLVTTYQPWDDPNTYLALDGQRRRPAAIIGGAPCSTDANFGAVLCPLDPSQPLIVQGSDGNDRLSIFDNEVPDAKSIQMHGNGGNDEIEDVFISTAGRVLTGGPGNDTSWATAATTTSTAATATTTVDGGEGDDQVRGGAGDDEMWGDHYKDPGADLLDGGPGTDTTEEWGIPSDLDRQPRVNVTLDGAANDGRPGEGDNVVGIERINMYVVGDFTGTDGPDQIKIVNPGNEGPSSLTGLGGDDTLVGYDFDDTVDGGAGNDTVEGGRGNDTVTGGPGRDTIYGDATSSHCSWYSCKIPFGNDVIQARDGEVDNIDCGIGTDTAVVDKIDVVANCETVQGADSNAPQPGAALSFKVKRTKLGALAKKGLTVAVPCPSACTVSGALLLKGKKVGSGRAKGSGTVSLKLKLDRKAKRRVKRMRKATLTVSLTATAGGAATAGHADAEAAALGGERAARASRRGPGRFVSIEGSRRGYSAMWSNAGRDPVKPYLAAALVLGAAVALAACGGDDRAAEVQRANCRAQAENTAEAAVIAEAYRRGDLTRKEVQAHFAPDDRIFDEQGRMVPYRELEGLTRARFDEYRGNAPFRGPVRDELQDAGRRVRDAGYPGC